MMPETITFFHMKPILLPLLVAAAAALSLTSCQTKKGTDTADMVALDYPFDEHGNYIEAKAQKLPKSTSKPVTTAMNTPPPAMKQPAPLPDTNYAPMQDVVPPPPPNVASNNAMPPRPPAATGGSTSSGTSKPRPPVADSGSSGSSSHGGKPKPKSSSSSSYTVVKGDTLSEIASKSGTSVAAIRNANGLSNTNLIRVGQKLKLPSGSKSIPSASSSKPKSGSTKSSGTSSKSGGSYTVKPGDSLWEIAHKNKTSVDAIKRANGLKSDALKPGQKLTLP